MKFENFNREPGKPRVLIAPLDWGLGHATRCIPVIYSLLEAGATVIIAAEGGIKKLLQKEFPQQDFVSLRGYNVLYSHTKFWLPLKIATQVPRVFLRIYSEHQWLKTTCRQHNIDAVISDNRFGLYHSTIPCVYITHQLKIKTGNSFTEWLMQKIHYFFINKYSQCWVPDNEAGDNLAGELSHPEKLPRIPVQYLGPLSRFKKYTAQKKYDCLAIISGPEPQRTIFEKLLREEFKKFTGTALLLRGLPGLEQYPETEANRVEIKNHLTAAELNAAILQTDIVICRSGYTTIMDLVSLQQKAILVPTPGQTEQEYLAEYLQQQQLFLSIPQQQFSLQQALRSSNDFPYLNVDMKQEKYRLVIKIFTEQLQQGQ